ncbi:unnamed protein product [Mytilus coruscus]|uniref:Macro domain-containing protein n=1 Tax=Mytilus coruscus TaxID=42192 RepID=A0A6J8CL85_MYTCO|nr:unnamed protein product [Mytilus coruscus]
MCSSFKLKCPDHSQWSLRARALCPSDPSKYSCIQNEHIKGYTEDCSVAEFERGGMKIILRGNLDAGPCSEERYQPGQMKYLTNVSSECIFSKSHCYEEGQILYDQGSPTQDVKCRCDFAQNYDFIYYSCILTPTVAKDPLTKTLRNEPVQPFIVKRNITKREKLNLSPCTAIMILIILAFPLSLLLCYDQRIDKLIDRQVRKGQNNAGSRRQTSETLQQRPNSVSMTESDFSKEPNPNEQGSTTPTNSIVAQAGGTGKAPNTSISHSGIQTIMSKSVATSNDNYDLKPDYALADNESDKYLIKVPLWIKSSKIKYFSSAEKPVIGEYIHREWKRLEKDTKCRIMVEPCHKSVFKEGWIAKTNKQLMNILLMSGTLNSIEGDIILCPVNKELEAMGFDSEVLMGGLNKEKLDRLLPNTSERKLEIGDVVRIYDPENLNCHCLLLTVLEDLNIKSHSDSLEQKVAAEVINTLVTNSFRSLGISLNYNKSPEWKMFSFTLLSCLWSFKSKLKNPVVVYCFGAADEFDSLDDYIRREKLKIDKCLVPIKTEPLEYQDEENSIKVSVEQGSILDYDTKVDVLINSVGVSLDLSNGIVSAKLVKIAGKSVQDECYVKYKNGINIGDIAITSPGNMICKEIFHVALYTYWVCDGNISAEILKNIVIKCLKEAEDRKMTSIAFPALGTGTLGYPPCLVAKTMFAAVDEYGRTHPTYLKQVYFVLFEDNIFQLFKNIDKWKKDKVKNSIEYDIPPKQLVYIPRDLETRVIVTDMEYFKSLKYKDLKAVVTESGSLDMKMDWNDQHGCFVIKIKMGRTEDGTKACFAKLIRHMQANKFHMADLFLQNKSSEVPINKQLKILKRVIRKHRKGIDKKNSTKNVIPTTNYVKLVRVFLKSEDYAEIVTECVNLNEKQDESKWQWHITNQTSFPFSVEVGGPKTTAEDIFKKVVQDISSIQATIKFKMKIQSTEMKKVEKLVEKLKTDISGITLDEDSNLVVCDATQLQISHVKKELAMYEDLSLSYDMSEDDYAALIYITNDDEWRSHVKQRYVKGKAIFDVEDSDAVSMVATCIKGKLEWLMQLAGIEVIPPRKHPTPVTDLLSEVEDTWTGMYCFLSFDRKRIIIKTSSYEQAQQAKYMMEVNLGMVQQGGGRRNRKFASPVEVGPGPVSSPSSTSDLTIRGGITFKTKEGIKIFVYSTGINKLKVDTLVNAANRDLMHGGGIAYSISNAAGYQLDKECDDYVRAHGSLHVGTCCSSTAGNLPYKSIIHAVGPMWHSYLLNQKQQCLDDLRKTVVSALQEAESCRYSSIAIPSISSGIFGVPKELCAKEYYGAVVEYSRKSPSSSVREIHFIDKDRGMCTLIQETFEKEFGIKGQNM